MDWEETPTQEEVLGVLSELRSSSREWGMMEVVWETERRGGPGGGEASGTVVVVDTNVLISHLPLLCQLVQLVSSSSSPSSSLLIPHIVLQELDGLKSSSRQTNVLSPSSSSSSSHRGRIQTSISSLARAATNWLLSALQSGGEVGVLRGQRKSETLLSQHQQQQRGDNDSLVLDAALFFQQQQGQRGGRTVLLSDDNNLRLRATFERLEATGVDPQAGAEGLLAKLETPVTASPDAVARAVVSPPLHPPVSPRQTRSRPPPTSTSFSITTSPRPTRRSPSRSVSLSPVTLSVPIPLSAAAISGSFSNGMELDPSPPPPLHCVLPPTPFLYSPVRSQSDLFANLCALIAHFLALPLCRHIWSSVRKEKNSEGSWEGQEELGDWRTWGARECVERCRRWWSEGDVEGLCREGLERTAKSKTVVEPPRPAPIAAPPPATPPRPRAPPPQPASASGRTTNSSRWSTPSSSRPPAPSIPKPTPAALPPPIPIVLPPPPSRATLPVSQRLLNLHRSLPGLISTVSSHTSPSSTFSFSAPRWEVLLEEVGKLLLAVLAGDLRADVREDVEGIVEGWAKDLRGLGIGVGRIEL